MSRTCYGGYGGFAAGVDSRIGRKGIQASVGFGGACYETHLRNLVYLSNAYRLPVVAKYWEHVIKMNDYQKKRFAQNMVGSMFNTVSGKKIACLGFAFKKDTGDTRETPAIDVCKSLLQEKAALVSNERGLRVTLIGNSTGRE